MSARIAPAREAAFEILRRIAEDRGNSDTLLHSQNVDRLSQPDRNLCTTLVLGTLRWQQVLDAECRRLLARPNLALAEDVLLALRLGAYQLLFLDRIPAHAAIFESVEWLKHTPGARQAGMVNAVLRKVAALRKPRGFQAELAYPEWMTTRWRKIYGPEASRRICEQGQREPRTALRLLTSDAEQAIEEQGILLEPGQFLAQARYVVNTPLKSAILPDSEAEALSVRELPGSLIQDEGSQLVAELLGQGKRILDCCAAPGGKAAVLMQNNPDGHLLACDINAKRQAAMQQRLARANLTASVEFRVADAARLVNVGLFDRILCDVPCSGTGTLARNPEIRHRLQHEDLTRQAERQRAILSSALQLLAPGGRLVYATCSLEPEENEQVVEACLESVRVADRGVVFTRKDMRIEFDLLVQQKRARGEAVESLQATGFRDGYLRTIPGVHPCDGFFAAMIERK